MRRKIEGGEKITADDETEGEETGEETEGGGTEDDKTGGENVGGTGGEVWE